MSYLDEPEAYRVTTSHGGYAEPVCGGGSSIIWIILFIIAFLAIAGLVGWIIWLYYNRNTRGKTLTILNPNISVDPSATSITGTWTGTSNTNDTVTLWASTQPPDFGPTGSILNSAVSSASQPASARSVTLTGLQPAVKYYATLIVSNPSTSNYHVYTQLVFMGTSLVSTPTNPVNFAIEHILQVGKIQIDGNNETVRFSQNPSEPNSLWQFDSHGHIVNTEGGSTRCLYANASNTLAVTSCDTVGATGAATPANSTWVYNPKNLANRWCLASTVSDTSGATGSCMVLGNITAPSGTASGFAIVTVSDSSRPGDAWVNAFETPSPIII